MMTPIGVLRYLHRDHNRFFRSILAAHGGQAKAFYEALDADFAAPDISRLWSENSRPSRALLEALGDDRSIERLSRMFGWDISSCRDEAEVDNRVRPGTMAQPTFIRRHDRSCQGIEANQTERALFLSYASQIGNLAGPICYDFSEHECGFVALTPIMMECCAFAERYRSLVFIHAGPTRDCFDSELAQYLKSLGVHPSITHINKAIDALHGSPDLLVLNGTQVIDAVPNGDDRHLATALIRGLGARAAERSWSRGPVLLASGPSRSLQRRVSSTDTAILGTRQLMPLGTKEANLFLAQQWLRFCKLRGVDPYAAPGSRVARARWHYSVARQSGFSINIRARAFFASNIDNQAFFDPTGGFAALAGMDDTNLPIDIFLFKRTVQGALDVFLQQSRDEGLQFLRFVSTAKHWLTTDALNDLTKRYEDDGRDRSGNIKVPNAREITELESRWRPWVHFDPQTGRHTMGIVAKALIQETWRDGGDAYDRRLAHYRVAKRMWARRDDKEFLSREFPYKPHWGRYRIHLLAEIIRHLARARAPDGCARPVSDPAVQPDFQADLVFPLAPQRDDDGTFSATTVDFCFRLFDEELNGNRYGLNTRALTRRHGANALAKELLQLLSDKGNDFGYAPFCMHPKLRPRYTAECGYAALSLGELNVADRCFEILIEMVPGVDALELLKARLDRSLVKTAADQLVEAEALLASVDEEATGRISEHRDLSQLRRRIKARRLQVQYHAQRSDDRSLAHVFDLYDKERRIKEIELLRCYILTLERVSRLPDVADSGIARPTCYDALSRCLSDAFTKASEGHHHDAMTLKILLAGIMRTRDLANLVVAEAMLDQVFQDIVAYGCAEVTLIRFLFEAGENLAAQGRWYRAYCIYLRRGYRRARARSFVREARQAAITGLVVLEHLREKFAALTPVEFGEVVKQEVELDRIYLQESAPSVARELAGKKDEHDPLYGFSMADDHGEERWLLSLDEIDCEIQELRRSVSVSVDSGSRGNVNIQ